jgi:hypothetical protein
MTPLSSRQAGSSLRDPAAPALEAISLLGQRRPQIEGAAAREQVPPAQPRAAADVPALALLAAELHRVQQRLQQVEQRQADASASSAADDLTATLPLYYAEARSPAAGGPHQQPHSTRDASQSSASAGMLRRASSRLAAGKRIESAENLHQATSTICLSDESAPRRKARFLLASFVVVGLQLMVACGILIAALSTACVENSQCAAGWFCTPPTDTENPQRCARCQIAGQNATAFCNRNADHPRCEVPVPGTVRDGRTAAWEGGCWDPINNGDAWLGDSFEEDVTKAVDAMKISDWLALLFAGSIASLSLAGELREIKLCQISGRAWKAGSHRAVRNSLWCLSAVRQFGLLPALAAILPNLVLERGSNVLDICFNTLAVLFLLDADNLVFTQFLGEETRARVAAVRHEKTPTAVSFLRQSRRDSESPFPILFVRRRVRSSCRLPTRGW